ncbi:MAG: aldo/keto reductase family protein, partial [Actinobacteria bacterium]|nr:aldo/keto reductase family protein [Actinomycetota bacterium]
MDYRHLGNTGMMVSSISYGNWITHGSQVEEKAAKACVAEALDCGITTFDTADVYAQGAAESVLGRALKGLRRDSIEIFTKVFWPTGPNPNNRGLSRKHIMESCDASLKRLKTDHVDLLQAHRFDHHTPLEETLRAFDDLVRQGKVHYIGVSEWTAGQIDAAVAIAKEMGFDRIVSNQPQYSLIWRVIEGEVVPTSQRHGMSQIVWSPLAQGVLTGKYLPGAEPPKGSRATSGDSGYISAFMNDNVLVPVAEYAKLCREIGHSPAEVALAWVLRNPNVASAIIGATRPKQVRENVKAVDLK